MKEGLKRSITFLENMNCLFSAHFLLQLMDVENFQEMFFKIQNCRSASCFTLFPHLVPSGPLTVSMFSLHNHSNEHSL